MTTSLDGLYARVKLSPLPGNKWYLLEDFTYYIGYKYSDNIINIPAGFIFDGASIPRLLHWVSTPMDTDTLIAALVHDYIFNKLRDRYTLTEANNIFNEIMFINEVKTGKRMFLYLGVRIGSWYVRKHK